ncbi:MAG: GerMN domain-containing protein, partial [Bacillota bacterium]
LLVSLAVRFIKHAQAGFFVLPPGERAYICRANFQREGKPVKYLVLILVVLTVGVAGGEAGQICAKGAQPEIYYVDRQGKLIYEVRQLTGDEDKYTALARAVLEQPREPHLITAIPAGTRLNNVRYDQGIVYVNYTKELFSYGGGTFREQRLLAQIIYTLTGLKEVRQVQILIEGQKVLAPEGSPTDLPLARSDLPLPVEEEKYGQEKDKEI